MRTALLVAMLVLLATPARAQECTSCWTSKCDEALRSYLPACPPPGKKKAPAPAAGKKKEKDKEKEKEVVAPACPDGRSITRDTDGHCCWAGQAWNGTACVGVPSHCPKELEVDVERQDCAARTCKPGKQPTKDGEHCCWPGQVYASTRDMCVSIPTTCPPGFKVNAAAQKCEPEECLPGRERVGKTGPCCWPGQAFDNASYSCVGLVQSCLPGFSRHALANACTPAPCGPGEVRATDEFHCCYPGQDWVNNACQGIPTVCPEDYSVDRQHNTCAPEDCRAPLERTQDGVHCCLPGQAFSLVERACTGMPTRCPSGQQPTANGCAARCEGGKEPTSDGEHCCYAGQRVVADRCAGAPSSCPAGTFVDGETCSPPECPGGMTRASDGVHCCWPRQGWSFERNVCVGAPACPAGLVADATGTSCVLASRTAEARARRTDEPAVRERAAGRKQAEPRTGKSRRKQVREEDDEDLPSVESGSHALRNTVRATGLTLLGCGLLAPVGAVGACAGAVGLTVGYFSTSGAWFQNLMGVWGLVSLGVVPCFALAFVVMVPLAGVLGLVDFFLSE